MQRYPLPVGGGVEEDEQRHVEQHQYPEAEQTAPQTHVGDVDQLEQGDHQADDVDLQHGPVPEHLHGFERRGQHVPALGKAGGERKDAEQQPRRRQHGAPEHQARHPELPLLKQHQNAFEQVGIGVDPGQAQVEQGFEEGGGEQQEAGDGEGHQLGRTKSIAPIEMLVTARTMGVTTQGQQLAFDQQVTRRADDHGVGIRHTIQPVEGIDKIYPKTPSLSCRSETSGQEKMAWPANPLGHREKHGTRLPDQGEMMR